MGERIGRSRDVMTFEKLQSLFLCAAITKHLRLVIYEEQNLFLKVLETGKSKIMALVSDVGLPAVSSHGGRARNRNHSNMPFLWWHLSILEDSALVS